MKFTPELNQKYFEYRLERHPRGAFGSVKCIFHDDRIASLSINLEKGVWKCHAGCGEGGIIDFEMRFSGCDRETSLANIAEIVGEPQFHLREQPQAIYQYRDALGRVVFEKLRFPGKRFSQRQSDGGGGWNYNLKGVSKPLYNLPEVLTANQIFIVEGEKDADNLKAALPNNSKVASRPTLMGLVSGGMSTASISPVSAS